MLVLDRVLGEYVYELNLFVEVTELGVELEIEFSELLITLPLFKKLAVADIIRLIFILCCILTYVVSRLRIHVHVLLFCFVTTALFLLNVPVVVLGVVLAMLDNIRGIFVEFAVGEFGKGLGIVSDSVSQAIKLEAATDDVLNIAVVLGMGGIDIYIDVI